MGNTLLTYSQINYPEITREIIFNILAKILTSVKIIYYLFTKKCYEGKPPLSHISQI